MFTTKINYKLNDRKGYGLSIIYSKWTGDIEIFVNDSLEQKHRILFGGEPRKYQLNKEDMHCNIEVYPGKAFWYKPVIKIVENSNETYYFGDNQTDVSKVKNFEKGYLLENTVKEGTNVIYQLIRGISYVFLLCGILIPTVTAVLHPEQFKTNTMDMILGFIVSIGLFIILFFLSKLLKNSQLHSQ